MHSAPGSRAILSGYNETSAYQPTNARSWCFLFGVADLTLEYGGALTKARTYPTKKKSRAAPARVGGGYDLPVKSGTLCRSRSSLMTISWRVVWTTKTLVPAGS